MVATTPWLVFFEPSTKAATALPAAGQHQIPVVYDVFRTPVGHDTAPRGAYLLLQMRTKVLNIRLEDALMHLENCIRSHELEAARPPTLLRTRIDPASANSSN